MKQLLTLPAFQFRSSLPIKPNHQGFSLVEVIVGMLIALLFVTTSLQLMVYALVLASQGRGSSTAKNWIQEDLEQVKSLAAAYKSTILSSATTVGATTLTVGWTTGFATGDIVRVGSDPNNYTVSGISGTTLTLSSGMTTVQSANANVTAVNMCNASTQANGFAFALRTNLPAVATTTKAIGGKNYTLTRGSAGGGTTPAISSTAPFNVLQISYKVVPEGETTPIATLDTEVIPDAAIKCP
ncbi:prepilin-type N-terminal cleavage/methylation domain-containing protein [Thermosynechococcaceae cyanobacterium BACA0444]|uniref:Prepilin-type N-terminal cleavage/methylation domain-containing protein n=1 Tax=Pseudocalidococcus azoricus BACA0444 TaxID=2918990 RepID=A0AAE4FQK9_9CYAN|nr:prepilin-type N-terminal cleavage/methylation domain-containing protein [Pseudocalidococcus azoricus]MDS3860418.1 prepilin-type N-terminal cleavage/methylation domain-containing protein [Pseudocalidococcus azoricus BACA0444]